LARCDPAQNSVGGAALFTDSTHVLSCVLIFLNIFSLQAFFANVAKARTVKTILQQCYGDKSTVTDELVQYVSMAATKAADAADTGNVPSLGCACVQSDPAHDCARRASSPLLIAQHLQVLKPGLDPGAARVFLEFLSYSSGPLPEEQFAKVKVGKATSVQCACCELAHWRCTSLLLSGMLPMVALQPRWSEAYLVAEAAAACNNFVRTLQVPVAVLWGAADPWEKVEWGRDFCPANYPAIEVLLSI
jgi:hypothetical protein